MKKIPSVFQRNYDGDRLVRDEVVPGSEWVLAGEGVPTVKWDGAACMVDDQGRIWKRYDRKRHKKTGEFKAAPPGWVPCEDAPNEHTGHWPGWLLCSKDRPEDRWFLEALAGTYAVTPGTHEAVGPKIGGNPHNFGSHHLIPHGIHAIGDPGPRDFESIRHLLTDYMPCIEGIVWHHADGRMAKIKRKDFGLPWPPSRSRS